MTFEKALPHVLRYEGGFVDNPNDPGGATNFGITQDTFDKWRSAQGMMLVPVRTIAMAEVESIYRDRYWRASKCDDLPAAIRLVHFDAAVNCGVAQAAKFLQRALGVMDDGIIGPITLTAASARTDPILREDLLWERLGYYRTIAIRKRPDGRNLREFLPGWIGRLIDLRQVPA